MLRLLTSENSSQAETNNVALAESLDRLIELAEVAGNRHHELKDDPTLASSKGLLKNSRKNNPDIIFEEVDALYTNFKSLIRSVIPVGKDPYWDQFLPEDFQVFLNKLIKKNEADLDEELLENTAIDIILGEISEGVYGIEDLLETQVPEKIIFLLTDGYDEEKMAIIENNGVMQLFDLVHLTDQELLAHQNRELAEIIMNIRTNLRDNGNTKSSIDHNLRQPRQQTGRFRKPKSAGPISKPTRLKIVR